MKADYILYMENNYCVHLKDVDPIIISMARMERCFWAKRLAKRGLVFCSAAMIYDMMPIVGHFREGQPCDDCRRDGSTWI